MSASQKSASPRSVRDAQKIYLDGDDGTVHRYFSTRGGGQELIALGDWLALPASAFDAVASCGQKCKGRPLHDRRAHRQDGHRHADPEHELQQPIEVSESTHHGKI